MASVLFGLGCDRDADAGALRRGEINILDHDWRGLRIQIYDGERLLAMIGLGVELEAEAAIDRDQIAAFALRAVLVGRADEIHCERSHGGQPCSRVRQEHSGRRDRTAFRGGLIDDLNILTGGGKKPETTKQNSSGAAKQTGQQTEGSGT